MLGKKNENQVTEEAVRAALSTVIEPELHRDLISLNMIRDLQIDGNDVSFTIMLTTPACPLRGKMEQIRRLLWTRCPASAWSINWSSNVPQDQRISQQLGQQFRNTIAVTSGKGGVGKTTVSVNLAISLATEGARVGLLDADILGPNVPMMMGVDQMPAPRERKMVPAEAFGVRFISMGFIVPPDQPLVRARCCTAPSGSFSRTYTGASWTIWW